MGKTQAIFVVLLLLCLCACGHSGGEEEARVSEESNSKGREVIGIDISEKEDDTLPETACPMIPPPAPCLEHAEIIIEGRAEEVQTLTLELSADQCREITLVIEREFNKMRALCLLLREEALKKWFMPGDEPWHRDQIGAIVGGLPFMRDPDKQEAMLTYYKESLMRWAQPRVEVERVKVRVLSVLKGTYNEGTTIYVDVLPIISFLDIFIRPSDLLQKDALYYLAPLALE